MKSTGIVRKVDELGRIVLPIELRKNLNVNIKDPLEIFVDKDSVILKKYSPDCIFCHEATNIIQFEGKNICKECLKRMCECTKPCNCNE